MEDFSKFMNKPESPVEVGKMYTRSDLLLCDTVYTVESIEEKQGRFYANCSYRSSFDDSVCYEQIYAFYLEELK